MRIYKNKLNEIVFVNLCALSSYSPALEADESRRTFLGKMTTARSALVQDTTEPLPKSRIGIFGTSANPPTGDAGHCGLLRYMVSTGKFDEIWVLPVYIHMFAAKRNLESFEHRVAMCKLCMEPLSTQNCTVCVLALEKHVFENAWEEYNLKQQQQQQQQVPQPRIGSIDIVRFIKNKYKNIMS